MAVFMFEVSLIDASLLPALMIAFVAGIVSFLSPCVLPIVPPYLAYMSGVTLNDLSTSGGQRARATIPALFFVLGLSTVFLFLGFAASAIGTAFLQYQSYFNTVAGILVMAFGAHFIGIYRIGFLDREARIDAGDRGGSAFGAYILGLAFAFGWTPCIGPVLSAILAVAAVQGTVGEGALLLAAYSLGLGIPFIAAAFAVKPFLNWMQKFRRHIGTVEKAMGGLLVLTGIMFITGSFTTFAYWLLEAFPALAYIG